VKGVSAPYKTEIVNVDTPCVNRIMAIRTLVEISLKTDPSRPDRYDVSSGDFIIHHTMIHSFS